MTELGNNSIIGKCVLLMFLIAVQATGKENYSETKCSSPLGWYKAVGCTPVRANLNDRCAQSYDCCHLDNLSRDKCYVNGNEYSIREMLSLENNKRCDRNCTCTQYRDTEQSECFDIVI